MQFITDQTDLIQICNTLKQGDWFTLDTEFMRERTYYTELCLIQVANDDVIACIDPFEVDDLEPLAELLYDPEITVVFHAAFQDLEIFVNLWGKVPSPIFDTQVAATLAGHGDQIGYANLVNVLTGIHVDKGQSRTDWKRRPLKAEQIDYAANDVTHLRDVYRILKTDLEDKGRMSWLDADIAILTDLKRFQNDDLSMWKKVKGTDRLRPQQIGVIQALAAWREATARTKNRPRQWILKDANLVDMARQMPSNHTALSEIRSLPERTLEQYSQELLNLLNTAAKQDVQLEKPQRKAPPTAEQQAIGDLLMAALRIIGNTENISPGALASRKDIHAFMDHPAESKIMQGWKRTVIGEPLQKLLKGKTTLSIKNNKAIMG